MTPTLTLKSYRPYDPRVTRGKTDGSAKLIHNGYYMQVTVFTYKGGEHGTAFTNLDAYFGGMQYHASIQKSYHPRWLSRLANQFEHQAYQDAKKRQAI